MPTTTHTDFTLSWVDDETEEEFHWSFRIFFPKTPEGYAAVKQVMDGSEGDIVSDLEAGYGTMDFTTEGWTAEFGYCLLECQREQVPEIAGKFRDLFIANGFLCGPVEEMTVEDFVNRDERHSDLAFFKEMRGA